jgi:hypothetical protein
MPTVAIALGVALVLLGAGGYVVTGMTSWTALIPALFGLPIAVLGAVATNPSARKHAMHAAAGLGLLGLLGSAMGLPKLVTLLSGGTVARPGAAVTQSLMAGLCLAFLVLCVKSFFDARRCRAAKPVGD